MAWTVTTPRALRDQRKVPSAEMMIDVGEAVAGRPLVETQNWTRSPSRPVERPTISMRPLSDRDPVMAIEGVDAA